LKRREFITNSTLLGGFTLLGMGSMLESCSTKNQPKFQGKRLIIVRARGGLDGYQLLADSKFELFNKLRPDLFKHTKRNGLDWKQDWKINPEFPIISELVQRHSLQFIPNIGFPDYNRLSHFAASDMWETGSVVGEKLLKTGWVGRLLDEKRLEPKWNNSPVLLMSDSETIFDVGKDYTGTNWTNFNPNANYTSLVSNWIVDYQSIPLDPESKEIFMGIKQNHRIQEIIKSLEETSGISDRNFLGHMDRITKCIRADVPFQVFHVTQDGYDTHHKQEIRMKPLVDELFTGLTKLENDLKASGHWDDTLVFVYTEFGRTIAQNANFGTDHGTANHAYLLGGKIPKLPFNNIPELQTILIGETEYLKHEVDFRDVYQLLTNSWLINK